MSTRKLVLGAFALSGAAALIYEVAWTRSLSTILGSTTYALSTMLGTFMTGLAIGGILGGKIADRSKNPLGLFAIAEFGIGIFGFLTIPIIKFLPTVYFFVHHYFKVTPSIYFAGQFLVVSLVMMVPTILMGATFPLVTKYLTNRVEEIGVNVGTAYSMNTVGAILGAYSSGFFLIPTIGIRLTTLTAASLNLGASLCMFILSQPKIKSKAVASVFIVALVSVTSAVISTPSEGKVNIFNFYTAARFDNYEDYKQIIGMTGKNVLFRKDSREGTVVLWRELDGMLRLRVGGKIEGTSVQDLENTLLLAYLPIAAHPNPRSFLTIGLGVGVTLGAARGILNDVSLVEINEAVIEAISKFGPKGLLDDINVAVDDARNHLLFSNRTYDIISSEPSYPTDQPTGNLFTEDFYRIAATRLNENGIFCQWLPFHKMSSDDVSIAIRTFTAVFSHASLWKIPRSNDLILIGSAKPFAVPPAAIRDKVRLLAGNEELSFVLSKSPEEISEIARSSQHLPINTDDRPVLEFSMVKAFLTRR